MPSKPRCAAIAASSCTRRRPIPCLIQSGSTNRSWRSRTPSTRTVVAKPTMSSVLVATLVSPSAMPSPSNTSASGWARRASRSPSLDSDALANTSVNAGRSAGVLQRIRNNVTAPFLPAQLTHPCRNPKGTGDERLPHPPTYHFRIGILDCERVKRSEALHLYGFPSDHTPGHRPTATRTSGGVGLDNLALSEFAVAVTVGRICDRAQNEPGEEPYPGQWLQL